MSDEMQVVEVESPPEVSTSDTDTGHDLDGFMYTDHSPDFPSEVRDKLEVMLRTRSYGWKSRARMLLAIRDTREESEARIQHLKYKLVDSFTEVTRNRNSLSDARSGLRRTIHDLSEEKLRQLCTLRDVDYMSFMKSGDKTGLVEAIIDETMKGFDF